MGTNKIYNRRDSATAVLRKMGFKAEDYNNHIHKNDDGTYTLTLAEEKEAKSAEKFVEKRAVNKELAETATKLSKAANHLTKAATTLDEAVHKVSDAASPEIKVKTKKVGISSVARQLILDGLDNKEVWDVLKKQFNLYDNKKHYPAWYRSELKRGGKIK